MPQQKRPNTPQASEPRQEQAGYEPNGEEVESAEVVASTYRRRGWKRYRRLAWFLLLIPIIYMAVQLFIILAPHMRMQTAMLDTMTESVTVQGFVAMKSVPLSGAGGILYYTAEAGQRVSVGAEVALVFDSEAAADARQKLDRVNAELELLAQAQSTVAEGGDLEMLTKEKNAGIYDFLADVETGDFTGIDTARDEITLAANKIQIATGETANFEGRIARLNEEKAQYEALAVPVGSITASEPGSFVPSGNYDQRINEYDTLAANEPLALQSALDASPSYYGSEVIGHIITDYKWQYFTCMPLKDAEIFIEGAKLSMVFPDIHEETMPVTIEKVTLDETLGLAKIELECDRMNADIMSLRAPQAQIIFREEKGLRVEKNALRLMDVEQEDGSVVTYKGVYVKFGNMVYFRRVEILLEDDNYMLISSVYEPGVNELEMYDEVVVDAGGVELYDKKIL